MTFSLPTAPRAAAATPEVRITEWMYNPVNSSGEFIEITNVGGSPVDLTDWSFDDDSRTPGAVSLASLGSLAAGESAIITESTAATFRGEWSLGAGVKILAGNSTNLGRADEINIFGGPDAADLVDRLTYNDQGTGTVRSPRTQGISGEPTSGAALGANDASQWQFSAVGDADKAWASSTGDIGSPGTSRFGNGLDPRGDGGPGTGLQCQPEAPEGTAELPATALTPIPWPGSNEVSVVDDECAWKTETGPEGRDISGLVFDPTDAGVVYAVKNKSWIFRLVRQDGRWVADTANGWADGKQIFFPGSTDTATNQPDTEGLTVGADGALYVTTERNNAANTTPLNSILRLDPNQAGSQLVATRQWDLTADFPELHDGSKTEANLGFEGVTFVPDSYLTSTGFADASTGRRYRPSDYPLHGAGLYFAALENDGKLYAYVLNSDGTHHRVGVVDTGMGHVMDVQYDVDNQRIWALCDNTCAVTSTVLKVDHSGAMVPEISYGRPTGLPLANIEGFALAPDSTCVNGTKEVLWSDDGIWGAGEGTAGQGHAIWSGRVNCDLGLGDQGVPQASEWNRRTVYLAGDRVLFHGTLFEALWWTQGQVPNGGRKGAWQEIATANDGTAIWTASRVFVSGDVVVHDGRTYRARWWTRGEKPKKSEKKFGPWELIG